MIRRPPRSTQSRSSAASDVYKRQATVRVHRPRAAAAPTLTPGQVERICNACAVWDGEAGAWRGSVRDRLLWMVLAETGVRLGEALGLQHRDWHTGRGDTPFVEVVPRDHPHGVRVKNGGYRKLYVLSLIHISEPTRLGMISYAVFCLKKKK